jgi:hypothetical protein
VLNSGDFSYILRHAPPKGDDEEGLLWVIHNAATYEGDLARISLPGLGAGAARGKGTPAKK